jgi:1,4-alpha-glucan branching enzyme
LRSRLGGEEFDKADPYGRSFEHPPATASRVWRSTYTWGDDRWVADREHGRVLERPMSIYEVHLGSWRRVPEEGNRELTYRELAPQLVEYVGAMGFTHVELLPVMEHPFYGSWGYQTTGYFAPTSRMGTPDDFKFLVDELHRANIGVILDWVPSHFPSDAFALARFDGTYLYEHADARQRVHPDWQSWTFNYSRNEVRSFLISNAFFWLDEFHADGLRVDAVASMLYLDYSRGPGQWVPNRYGGNEDLDAVDFIRQCTYEVTNTFAGVTMIAEESTAWPGVSAPVEHGGLGFNFKWDMGWMHDTLVYLQRDAVHRKFHQHDLTFRAVYAADERFVLPLSHDEVVHGKGSLLAKMAGDDWQRRANLRLLFGYQFSIPGKKLLFMGDEFAQSAEWSHEASLDWHLLGNIGHRGVTNWVQRLNALYRERAALHRDDIDHGQFEWVHFDDSEQSVLIWRRGHDSDELMVIANFTPVPRDNYEFLVSCASDWSVLANSDDAEYGGSGYLGESVVTSLALVGRPDAYALRMSLPPLSIVVLGRIG